MRILVDAMGGDNAPAAAALGAIRAAADFGVEIVLVGRGGDILKTLRDHEIQTLPKGVEIANAEDVVDMHDDPAKVLKKRPDSSMVVGLQMLRDGGGDAFVSAGSTGALLSAATLTVRRVKGIRRAAMGPVIPTATGSTMLIDCGATADCTPEFLLQFAFMGSYCARKLLGVEQPRVALLNIGAEDNKGGELQKAVYPLLQKAGDAGYIRFIGNIEARDVPLGGADVVVADGFSGNVLLKGIEGTAKFLSGMMKDMFKRNLFTKLAALACRSGIQDFKKKMDYRETGGTLLLGLRKPVVKAHGSSDELAFYHAVRQAVNAVEANITQDIEDNIEKMAVPKELEHADET